MNCDAKLVLGVLKVQLLLTKREAGAGQPFLFVKCILLWDVIFYTTLLKSIFISIDYRFVQVSYELARNVTHCDFKVLSQHLVSATNQEHRTYPCILSRGRAVWVDEKDRNVVLFLWV